MKSSETSGAFGWLKILGKIALIVGLCVAAYFSTFWILRNSMHSPLWKSAFFIPAQWAESSVLFFNSSHRYNGVWITKDPTAPFVSVETHFDLYRCTLIETDATGRRKTTVFTDRRNPVYGNKDIILSDGDRYLWVPWDGSLTLRLDISTGPPVPFIDSAGRKQYSTPQRAIHLVPKV